MKSTGMESTDIDILSCLPVDVALKIASCLQVFDICALSCCSRFWRKICGSDSVWEPLSRQRWPHAIDSFSPASSPIIKGWRKSYVRMHREMAGKASALIQFVERCSTSESLEFRDFNKAVAEAASMKLELRDVQMFLFKPELSMLVYLVGLYYCINCLIVPGEQVIDALESCKISERKLCIKLWNLGRWLYGFGMRDECHSCTASLVDLLKDEGKEVLKVMGRGPIHEVFRIEFAISNNSSAPWSCQSSQIQDQWSKTDK